MVRVRARVGALMRVRDLVRERDLVRVRENHTLASAARFSSSISSTST